MRVTMYALLVLLALVDVLHAQEQSLITRREFTLLVDGTSRKALKFGEPKIGTPAVVKYRFLSWKSPSIGNWLSKTNCDNLLPIEDEAQRKMLKQQFAVAAAEWSKAAQIDFQYVEDDDDLADVLVGFQNEPVGYALANVNVMHTENGDSHTITRGLVCLHPKLTWVDRPTTDKGTHYAAFVFAHEIGHILGFDHPDRISKDSLMFMRYPQERSKLPLSLSDSDITGARFLYGSR